MIASVDPDADSLAQYLRAQLPKLKGGVRLQRIGSGQSNPTYSVTCANGPDLILRKQPPGPMLESAHAVDREYRILKSLHPIGIPVPEVILFCEDREVIGTPFYLMRKLHGRVLSNYALPGIAPRERRRYLFELAERLAQLHAVDWAAAGLTGYGKPGGFFARQIGRWTRQWKAVEATADVSTQRLMEPLLEWLPAHIPADDETTIAHGDYRLGNVMFHPTEPKIIGILDWELSTLGNPLADAAYSSLPWLTDPDVFEGLRGLDLATLQIPTQDEYLAAYRGASGRDGILPFHHVFALFRFAVILEGIRGRASAGNAVGEDAAAVANLASRFAGYAVQLIKTEG